MDHIPKQSDYHTLIKPKMGLLVRVKGSIPINGMFVCNPEQVTLLQLLDPLNKTYNQGSLYIVSKGKQDPIEVDCSLRWTHPRGWAKLELLGQ